MIQAILVFNNHGKPRLVRFYQRFVSADGLATPLQSVHALFPAPGPWAAVAAR
jgi:hypothetical protein